jgi:hypothetical protein
MGKDNYILYVCSWHDYGIQWRDTCMFLVSANKISMGIQETYSKVKDARACKSPQVQHYSRSILSWIESIIYL